VSVIKHRTCVNMMNRHAVEEKYFHVILLTDDSTVRSLDRSRSLHNAFNFIGDTSWIESPTIKSNGIMGSRPNIRNAGVSISANACPSEAAAVQTVEEVHHHINF